MSEAWTTTQDFDARYVRKMIQRHREGERIESPELARILDQACQRIIHLEEVVPEMTDALAEQHGRFADEGSTSFAEDALVLARKRSS